PTGIFRLDAHRPSVRLDHRYRAAMMARRGPHAHDQQQRAAEPAGDDGQTLRALIHPAPAGDAIGRTRRFQIVRHGPSLRFAASGAAQRISSTGSTPITAKPERMTTATAATRASRARVSAGLSAWRKRSVESTLPRFHSI